MNLDSTWIGFLIRLGIILLGLVLTLAVVLYRRAKRSPLARLTVEDSEVTGLIHTEYLIKSYPVTIGRVRENDVALLQDETVSRFHAQLECSEGKVVLKEVLIRDADGRIRGPLNGTFVDDQQLNSEAAPLEIHSGSKIRLGTRLVLRFDEIVVPPSRYQGTRGSIPVPTDVLKKNKEQ
jgi:pSer/pThr/pTyr-binding forkhead associated (FHA) protein